MFVVSGEHLFFHLVSAWIHLPIFLVIIHSLNVHKDCRWLWSLDGMKRSISELCQAWIGIRVIARRYCTENLKYTLKSEF